MAAVTLDLREGSHQQWRQWRMASYDFWQTDKLAY